MAGTPCDDGGRSYSKASTSMVRYWQPQRPGERHKTDSSSEPPEGARLVGPLISHQLPELSSLWDLVTADLGN